MIKSSDVISKEQMIAAVTRHEVFSDLTAESQKQLQEIAELKIVNKNETLFEIGDFPNFIFYLLSGSLTLHFPDNSKLDLEAGELIGEIGFLNGDFRLGTLKATSDCQLIKLCGNKMYNTKFVSPDTSLIILRRLSKRVTNYLKSLQQTSTKELIAAGESEQVEFKSTMRWNLKADKKDKAITHAVLKTIAAFLNTSGGTLIIGAKDNGNIIGLEEDRFENEDKMLLFLTSNMKTNLGTLHLSNIHFHIEEIDDTSVIRVDIQPGDAPCYVKSGNNEHFYLRTGPATTELSVSKIYTYIKRRFYTQDELYKS